MVRGVSGFQAGLDCRPPPLKFYENNLPDLWYLQEETQKSMNSVGSSFTLIQPKLDFYLNIFCSKMSSHFKINFHIFHCNKKDNFSNKSVADTFWINVLLDVHQLNIHIFLFLPQINETFILAVTYFASQLTGGKQIRQRWQEVMMEIHSQLWTQCRPLTNSIT